MSSTRRVCGHIIAVQLTAGVAHSLFCTACHGYADTRSPLVAGLGHPPLLLPGGRDFLACTPTATNYLLPPYYLSRVVMPVLSEEDLERVLAIKYEECESFGKGDGVSEGELMCGTIWDGIMCWPPTKPKHVSSQQCPQYFPGLNRPGSLLYGRLSLFWKLLNTRFPNINLETLQGFATKECTENGTWFISYETQKEWTNYSDCYAGEETIIFVPVPEVNASLFKEYLPTLKRLSHIGYGVSLSTLVIAFFILVTLKKLHCSRNKLHLHLFMSFIMKSVLTFAKESLFEQGVGLQSDFVVQNGTSYFIEKMDSNWECKLVTTVWQYFIMANYSWVLMEGLYIHNLIIFALFSDNSSIIFYVIFGWGLPLVFVSLWVFAKIKLENELCWTTNTDSKNFLIIRIPIIISISLSFILFVNIVRLLLVKVRSTVQEDRKRYWKWAKSTLVLIPLFGVHYAIFHGMSYSRGVNERVELIWLFCDQLFASFQGFFVAVLFFFLNSEIQAEMRRKWKRVRCPGSGDDAEGSTLFQRLALPCTIPEYSPFKSCIGRSDGVHQESRSKACKRTDTVEFTTNDSDIAMTALGRERRGKGVCEESRNESMNQAVLEVENITASGQNL